MTRGTQVALGGGLVALLLFLLRRRASAALRLPAFVSRKRRVDNLEPLLDAITRAAAEAGISPLLLAAHALTESAGNPRAVRVEVAGVLESGARTELQRRANANPAAFMDDLDAGRAQGARTASVGLMQILPATAREVGFVGPSRDLFTADVNLKFGARYLKKLIQRYPTDVRDAIASYNAGSAKYARPSVAAVLVAEATKNKMSPCAFVAGSKSRVVQAAVVAAGGAFELARGDDSARALRSAGKTYLCNRAYVGDVLDSANQIRAAFPTFLPMDNLPMIAGLHGGRRKR